MAANISPIYGRTPDVQLTPIIVGPTAVTAMNGTGNLEEIFRADTTEGSFVDHIVIKPATTTNTAATVARIFLCSSTDVTFVPGTSNVTTNTNLLTEIALPAVNASSIAATPEWGISIRRGLPPGYRLLIGFGTSTGAAGVGFCVTTFGSKY